MIYNLWGRITGTGAARHLIPNPIFGLIIAIFRIK